MAKSNRGGKRTAGASSGSPTVSVAQSTQVQTDTTQQAQAMSVAYDNFMAMSDDEKANAINSMTAQEVPVFLADNSFQRLTFNMGMNDKPELVDDKTLDSMNGTEVFRTVNNAVDTTNHMRYNADEIANQVTRGQFTRVSDSGGSALGRGIYFADNYNSSVSGYGNTTGNIKKTAVIRGKLNSNAKIIDLSVATNRAMKEMSSGSKLGNALKKCDYESVVSVYSLAKGYNVIQRGSYLNILNRNAVTMSSDIKSASNKWK